MGAVIETWRGASAMLRYLLGMPYMGWLAIRTPGGKDAAIRILAAHSARFLRMCRIEVDLSGTPPLPGTSCVVCYSESSFADLAAFTLVMWPHIDRAAAAQQYARIPFVRRACDKVGIVMVPRGNRAGTERLMTQVVKDVKGGDRFAWGGEGRLSGIDGVERFKIGASLIAIRAQVPLVPVAFYGGHNTLPLGTMRARPGKISVRFGNPISTDGLAEEDARAFADQAQAAVSGLYAELKKEHARLA